MSIKLVLKRNDIAANLQAYGEPEIAARISTLSDTQYESLCEVGGKLSLEGEKFAEAACLAAVHIIEGRSRSLRRARRDWSLVDPKLLEPDPVMVEIDQWIARYADGELLSTAALVECVREALAPQLSEFKYFKSKRCFRRKTSFGWQQIVIEASYKTGLHFRFGVRNDEVEAVSNSIRGRAADKWTNDLPTISKWSYNMGPNNHYWKHHIYPVWPITGYDGLAIALPEIERFVEEIMLPFLEIHSSMPEIRESFLNYPARYDQMAFAPTVFSIDVISGRNDLLDSDYQRVRHLSHNWPESSQLEIVTQLERAKQLGANANCLDN